MKSVLGCPGNLRAASLTIEKIISAVSSNPSSARIAW